VQLTKYFDWPLNKIDAIDIQKEMAKKVEIFSNFDDINLIAAVDTAYGKNAEVIYASVVLIKFPDIEEIERRFQYEKVSFPYIPGMFYFREGEAIEKVLQKLDTEPDLLIIHGHGIAHPLRCGLASQIGIGFDKPSIGCARKLICGNHREVGEIKGNSQPIYYKDKEVGIAYRSKENVKPIFISPGHKCDVKLANEIIVKNLRGYRMPEPLRLAHLFANKFKRHIEKNKK
jgi:deoxyribonuclease V